MTERLHFHFSPSCIGEGNGNPLQCSCLENPRDGGALWAAIYGVAQSRTRLTRLSSSSSKEHLFSWSPKSRWLVTAPMKLKDIYFLEEKLSCSEVTQSCPTLCDPMDCSLPGSSVHGIFQARILEWVAIAFSIYGSIYMLIQNS